MKRLSNEAYNKLRKMEVIDSNVVKELVFSDYKSDEITKPKIKKLHVQDFDLEDYPEKEHFPFKSFEGSYVWTAMVKNSKKILIWHPFAHEYYEVNKTNVKFSNAPLLSFDDDWLFGIIPVFSKLCRIYQIENFVHIINNDKLHEALNCEITVSLRKHIQASRCFSLTRTSMKALYDQAFIDMLLVSDITGLSLSERVSYMEIYDKLSIENHIKDVDYTNLPELYR